MISLGSPMKFIGYELHLIVLNVNLKHLIDGFAGNGEFIQRGTEKPLLLQAPHAGVAG